MSFDSLRHGVNTLDWSKVPDLAAVALLTCAFASVARRGQTPFSGLWLTGWILIALHFAAFIFLSAPGVWGILAADIGLAALTGAGVLFMYASVPYRRQASSKWILLALLVTNTLYVCIINSSPAVDWALTPAAILFGAVPLTLALISIRQFSHPLRWIIVSLYCALSVFLLLVQHRSPNGLDLALNGVLFAVYLGMLSSLLVHLPKIHGGRVHHHRRVLRLGLRIRGWTPGWSIPAQGSDRKRSLEPSQICGRCRHDPVSCLKIRLSTTSTSPCTMN